MWCKIISHLHSLLSKNLKNRWQSSQTNWCVSISRWWCVSVCVCVTFSLSRIMWEKVTALGGMCGGIGAHRCERLEARVKGANRQQREIRREQQGFGGRIEKAERRDGGMEGSREAERQEGRIKRQRFRCGGAWVTGGMKRRRRFNLQGQTESITTSSIFS